MTRQLTLPTFMHDGVFNDEVSVAITNVTLQAAGVKVDMRIDEGRGIYPVHCYFTVHDRRVVIAVPDVGVDVTIKAFMFGQNLLPMALEEACEVISRIAVDALGDALVNAMTGEEA